MSDRPRPASLRRGPAPSIPPPDLESVRVTFGFGSSLGEVSVTFPRAELEKIHEIIAYAWNSPGGAMFTVEEDAGKTLINLSRVIAVTIR